MPGNEVNVVNFLIENKDLLSINHIGLVKTIQNPSPNGSLEDIESAESVTTESSGKKADIFINGHGVSIKQEGGSFAYNRIQRAGIKDLFIKLGLNDPDNAIAKLDNLIEDFHSGKITRTRPWSEAFNESDFKLLLKFLMMDGSVNLKESDFPASYILTMPKSDLRADNIHCYTFDEYFKYYKDKIFVSLRRQWVGQLSNSEHKRALGLMKNEGNAPWVFSDVVGTPRTGWRSESEIPESDRKTVYMIFIEVKD
jgi:hypothetical protein